MALIKITRPGNHPGLSKINDYAFQNGVIVTNRDTGEKLASILCRYYGCSKEELPDAPPEKADPTSASLEVTNTRDGVADDSADEEEESEDL